jgi:hypothetical protein
MVAQDNWNPLPGAVRVWTFGTPMPGPAPQGRVVYRTTDWAADIGNLSHVNATPGVASTEQFVCGGNARREQLPRNNEIVCFRLDGSLQVVVVAPVMTDLNAPGGVDDYRKQPKGNLDGPRLNYTIAANDQLQEAAAYRPLVVAYRNGSPIRLSDVAQVLDGVENSQLAGWANEHPAVIQERRGVVAAHFHDFTAAALENVPDMAGRKQISFVHVVDIHALDHAHRFAPMPREHDFRRTRTFEIHQDQTARLGDADEFRDRLLRFDVIDDRTDAHRDVEIVGWKRNVFDIANHRARRLTAARPGRW